MDDTRERLRRIGLRLVAANPLYLLSAACMAYGLFYLVRGIRQDATLQIHVITLLATEAYELLACAMCVLLARWRREPRDAGTLLVIIACFLSGAPLLEHGFFTWEVGWPVVLVVSGLTITKFLVFSSLLRLAFTRVLFVTSLLLHLLNTGLPALMQAFTNPAPYTRESLYERFPAALGWLWLLPLVFGAVLFRVACAEKGRTRVDRTRPPCVGSWQTPWWWTLIALAGLCAQLTATSWTYGLPFFPWSSAFAGLAVGLVLLELCLRFSRHGLAAAAAIPAALVAGAWSGWLPRGHASDLVLSGLAVSPFQAALAGLALVYLGLAARHRLRELNFLAAAVSTLAVASGGGSDVARDVVTPSLAVQAYVLLLLVVIAFRSQSRTVAIASILVAGAAGITAHGQLGSTDAYPLGVALLTALYAVGVIVGGTWAGRALEASAFTGLTAAAFLPLGSSLHLTARVLMLLLALGSLALVWVVRRDFRCLPVLTVPALVLLSVEAFRREPTAGTAAILAAFVLLLGGFGVSLAKRRVLGTAAAWAGDPPCGFAVPDVPE